MHSFGDKYFILGDLHHQRQESVGSWTCCSMHRTRSVSSDQSCLLESGWIGKIQWNLYLRTNFQNSIHAHRLHVAASTYLPVDETNLATGEIASVENTKFDFREPKELGAVKDDDGMIDLDNDWILDKKGPEQLHQLSYGVYPYLELQAIFHSVSGLFHFQNLWSKSQSEHFITLGSGPTSLASGWTYRLPTLRSISTQPND